MSESACFSRKEGTKGLLRQRCFNDGNGVG
jgi:hypothetical protein